MIAVASTSSYVSVLCPRTGRLVAATRAYDSDLAKMSFFDRSHLITANHDRAISLWSVNDPGNASTFPFEQPSREMFSSVLTLTGHYRSSLSDNPVAILPGQHSPIMVACTADRLQYYANGFDPRSTCQDFLFNKLDQLRGKTVTSAAVIPSSGFILLGTDAGTLHLLA